MEENHDKVKYITEPIDLLRSSISSLENNLANLKLMMEALGDLFTIIDVFAENAAEGCALVQDNKLLWVNKAAK
ncbi:MAG: hypothetical protein PHU23_14075, partial [Dehalococcoidales bacterium]|nr:hypothetical protein [Dehalococcoidales bacterium]